MVNPVPLAQQGWTCHTAGTAATAFAVAVVVLVVANADVVHDHTPHVE